MKALLLICFFFVSTQILLAQTDPVYLIRASEGNYDLNQCRAIVLAPSGLKLRSKPDFKASVIAVIPYTKEVSYSCKSLSYDDSFTIYDADSIPGIWLPIFWRGYNGYAFSAYLGNGIFKMDRPFYLLSENVGGCWDDSYISSEYQYYGVYFNKDSSAFVIQKRKPTFYSYLEFGTFNTTFSFKQPKGSEFAFASREPFKEGLFSIVKSTEELKYEWGGNMPTQGIRIPKTTWEVKMKLEHTETEGDRLRLMIRDRNSGTWHYLMGKETYFSIVSLRWSGDMDGDGIQDFMLDVSTEHDGGMVLFLSKNRGKNELIHMAGKYFWYDCC